MVVFFVVKNVKKKRKKKEKWLGEVKTVESDETRKERNEFSRAK